MQSQPQITTRPMLWALASSQAGSIHKLLQARDELTRIRLQLLPNGHIAAMSSGASVTSTLQQGVTATGTAAQVDKQNNAVGVQRRARGR